MADGNGFKPAISRHVNPSNDVFPAVHSFFRVFVVKVHFYYTCILKMNTEALVYLFHIVLVSGLFFYVGFQRDQMPSFMFPVLIGVGIFIGAYHLFKAFMKKDAWVNYIHIFLIAPLLVWIGLCKEKTPRKYFEVLLMLGFASFGYHGYYLFDSLFSKE